LVRKISVFYPELEQLLLYFFPGSTDALVYNHDVFDQHCQGEVVENQDNQDLGVNTGYSDGVHNDLNDNSGCVRCRELLIRNLRNFGCEQHCTEAEAEAKLTKASTVRLSLLPTSTTSSLLASSVCAVCRSSRFLNDRRGDRVSTMSPMS
jgi:hypothetical protein